MQVGTTMATSEVKCQTMRLSGEANERLQSVTIMRLSEDFQDDDGGEHYAEDAQATRGVDSLEFETSMD